MSKPNVNSILSPELKGWLDNVVVTALLREYIAELERENSACSVGELVPQSAPTRTAIADEGR